VLFNCNKRWCCEVEVSFTSPIRTTSWLSPVPSAMGSTSVIDGLKFCSTAGYEACILIVLHDTDSHRQVMQEALESQAGLDDSQWLTYWILSAAISIVERFLGRILYRLPFFTELKLVFLMWLVLPYFNGAAALYDFVRPQITNSYSVVRQNVNELKGSKPSQNEGGPRQRCLMRPAGHQVQGYSRAPEDMLGETLGRISRSLCTLNN
jgi:hypothetical protein